LREQIEELPPFLSDSQIQVNFRNYYLRKDRASGTGNEAWAMGGSIAYRSGWLADFLQVELEGFTSQPIVAPQRREGTGLLQPVQDGYGVLGIANAKLRYKGLVLTGFRQYLDLPYINRNDSRMTPNTYESITLAKPEGNLRFSTGYTWGVKLRNSDEFESMSESIGLSQNRGLAHAGAVWDPNEDLHLGLIAGIIPDVFAGMYTEFGIGGALSYGWEARFDSQFSFQKEVGDDLLGDVLNEAWNLGIRASVSRASVVLRLGLSITGSDSTINNFYGSSPSYVDLMQRTFNRADSKAILASASYDFSRLGANGLTAIVNFVASFDGVLAGVRGNAQEVDLTIDYRPDTGWLKSLWLRARGSWLNDDTTDRDGTDIRLIVRYDLTIL
jgi:hypothetical protein